MNKNISIIILAAGAGTRMKSDIPKVLHKISGKEMLYYVIKEAKILSNDIHVVLYHKFELVQNTIEQYFDNIKFHIQDHQNYPGTGGAVMNIIPKYSSTLVLNADMPLVQANELKNLIQNELITMSVLKLDDASGYGRVKITNNQISKIIEQKDCNTNEIKIKTANAGVYCFDTKFLIKHLPLLSNNNAQKEYYITDLIEIAVKQKIKIKPIFVDEHSFKGVNTKFDLSNAEIIHQKRIKKELMINGVTMILPDTIYIESDVVINGQCIVENNVTILGNSNIINSHIKANSIVQDSIIQDSQIGPMARIRPKSNIKDSHIGNFVEIKQSNLNKVKAGHLTYLGNSHISEGTNIGAGTITCNYDGKNKYETIIGKNVFIGSNTKLIAPIKLEDNCITGAGSTISKDIKDGELVLERARVKKVKGYFYKFFS